jgi:hypothetical protein
MHLSHLASQQLDRLQRIQNSAARLVTLTRCDDHITPVLGNLHWLTVRKRVQFNILLLTYKDMNGLAPSYLIDILKPYKQTRTLRYNAKCLLAVPSTKTTTFGDRACAVCAPKLWNMLPLDTKNSCSLNFVFKGLKTYVFQL